MNNKCGRKVNLCPCCCRVTSKPTALKGIECQLTNSGPVQYADNQPVVFQQITMNTVTSDIVYDSTTGTFTFNKLGLYDVLYWLVIHGSDNGTDITFDFGGSKAKTNLIQGQMTGEALINVVVLPTSIRLLNVSNQIVQLDGPVDYDGTIVGPTIQSKIKITYVG